jgi:hypothetical protein
MQGRSGVIRRGAARLGTGEEETMQPRAVLAAVLLGVTGLSGLTACSERPQPMDLTGEYAPLVPSSDAPSPTGDVAVPAEYRGRWNTSLAECSGDSGEGRLIVEAEGMTFHESVGRVVAVTPQAQGISVTVQLTGEGETREDTRTWQLSADGATLTDVTTGATRSRCP